MNSERSLEDLLEALEAQRRHARHMVEVATAPDTASEHRITAWAELHTTRHQLEKLQAANVGHPASRV